MLLRYQLLLLSLLSLLLPWAGCHYAREMENVLRDGEEQALLSTTSTLASVLATRPELLRPEAASDLPFDPHAGDLYAFRLATRPLLDGYGDDWGLPPDALARIDSPGGGLPVDYMAGIDGMYFYLLLIVADQSLTFEASTDAQLEPTERGDHVWLAVESPAGNSQLYLLMTSAPGLFAARRQTVSAYGERGEEQESRIQAWWQPEHKGYRLEVRLPLTMLGDHLGFEVVDIGARGDVPRRTGTLTALTHVPSGRVLRPSAVLAQELTALLPADTRVTVSDRNGWILGDAGAIAVRASRDEEERRPAEWVQAIYRSFLDDRSDLPARTTLSGRMSGAPVDDALAGKAGTAWFRLPDEHRTLLVAAAPIVGDGAPAGAVMLEQAGDRLLTLRDRALTRLFNVTLLATAIAVIALLTFAVVLSVRIGRLKRAAENALTRDGRLNTVIPETRAGDELGQLARSFTALLRKLDEHTDYLRTLGGKLSHELRTPLAIVRSSLDNLQSESGDAANPYVTRAREGSDRLLGILTAMGAAARTQDAISQAELVTFDLAVLVRDATRAYGDAFPARAFAARVPDGPCQFRGAADLIVQLLDKLVENAVDFSPAGATVQLALEREAAHWRLSVENPGAAIPEAERARLFESMLQFRRDSTSAPHFGLGLYIVRLIAEFHGGSVFAENVAGGVRVGVMLPVTRG